ncbi:Uncharacterized protein OS=Singulisphaera acidiphila (strain ATCC BAA-1392 / DSM 18658 / VKM B-2454 / MOB10) GN=Sinac_7637 PE=4 SV=1 [Gemmata massiliana]|uniref:Uncharacterized protein n=1 Tax=Gemmata massiliana TaxID=1210884 RepID=A0A6P2CSV7_9BACT|nr:hypothetical protein [Gemmata massiliana]VTR91697.1 Uncharacterized protein OS=Singulisphaera acidiphila (strain ATCC BAA-1392 / DSM 18658 / VKM B-2454 / MOB10) GN=Sinac_7637 PE=4 SV=1 [Gemmata massiliana]
MGWENRGGQSYYYTAERVNGRVVKQYVGTGMVATLAAQLHASTRTERAATAEADQRARAELEALDAALAPLYELADAATVAALVAAGYHRPKRGPWRKRRAQE